MLRPWLFSVTIMLAAWALAWAFIPVAARAAQTDCKNTGYACTPGYNAVDAQSTWPWTYYGGQNALTANGYHNCTLYAAWRLEQNGLANPGNWGNAIDWINHVSHDHTLSVGAIAWWGIGKDGHVAYVDRVNGDEVHVEADNFVGPKVNGYTDSGWIPTSSVPDFLHPKVATLHLIRDASGNVWAKNSVGVGGWTEEVKGGIKAVAAGGGTQMILDTAGNVWAKNSAAISNSGWIEEVTGGQKAISAGDGGLQMILDGTGNVCAKNSLGVGGWTEEVSGGQRSIATG